MKNSFFYSFKFVQTSIGFLFILTITSFFSIAAQAQSVPSSSAEKSESHAQNEHFRKHPFLLQSLNLTVNQMQQIRNINLETREDARQAFQQQRMARRALDAAIYADVPDQTSIDQRLREFNEAQAKASKLRVAIELRIRQVLTTEQLVRFRELRQTAEQKSRERKQSMLSRRKLQRF